MNWQDYTLWLAGELAWPFTVIMSVWIMVAGAVIINRER